MGLTIGEMLNLLERRGFTIESEMRFSDNSLEHYPEIINTATHAQNDEFTLIGDYTRPLKDAVNEEDYNTLKNLLGF